MINPKEKLRQQEATSRFPRPGHSTLGYTVMILTNAFSLNMLGSFPASVEVNEVGLDEARALAGNSQSAVGHADTAAVFADVLGLPVPANRTTISLSKGDEVLVGQYIGPRLPEGATALPEGATIKWLTVSIR